MANPDYNELIDSCLGWRDEVSGMFGSVVGIVTGANTAYTLTDFLNVFPKFFGSPTSVTGALTQGSKNVTLAAANSTLAAGQLIVDAKLPYGTVISSVSGTAMTLSNSATATSSAESMSVYTAPVLPLFVMQMYITLATSCLVQNRWFEMWQFAMTLYVAHYCTLYLRSEGNPGTTAGQIAVSGLERGVQVSRGTGPLSASIQTPSGLEDWGVWTETTYGSHLVTIAKTIGSGIVVVR